MSVLVESPEMWRWSSYRSSYGERGEVRVSDWEVLRLKVCSSAG
jgi:hypothetical protein